MSRAERKPGMSLSRRLLIGVLPAAIMFVVLLVFFTTARLEDSRRDLAESSQLFADSLAPALEYAVVSGNWSRSEEHTSELQSRPHLVCRLLLEKKKTR